MNKRTKNQYWKYTEKHELWHGHVGPSILLQEWMWRNTTFSRRSWSCNSPNISFGFGFCNSLADSSQIRRNVKIIIRAINFRMSPVRVRVRAINQFQFHCRSFPTKNPDLAWDWDSWLMTQFPRTFSENQTCVCEWVFRTPNFVYTTQLIHCRHDNSCL